MVRKEMITEGLSINQLEERLEMAHGGFLTCCSESVVSCGLGSEVNVNVTVTVNK